VTDFDTSLVHQIFDITRQKRGPDIHHHGQTDDLRARLEVAKRAACYYTTTLVAALPTSISFTMTVPGSAIGPSYRNVHSAALVTISPWSRMTLTALNCRSRPLQETAVLHVEPDFRAFCSIFAC
jgi:hypothetical protein